MFGLFVFLFLFSILAGAFLIYKPELLSLYFNRIITRRQIVIGFIVYMVIFLPIMIIVASTEGVFLPSRTLSKSGTPLPSLQTPTTLPTLPPSQGLHIRRSILMALIQQQNTGVSFLPGKTYDGQSMYTATQYKNSLSLIGPEDNLTEIKSTEPLDSNANDNLETVIFILGQASLVDSDISQWIGTTIQQASASINGPSPSDFSRSYVLHQRQYVFMIQNSMATLTIKPLLK